LALKDWRKVAILALLGASGLAVGVFATLSVGSYFNYSSIPLGALVGVVVAASLGVAFLDWRKVVGLAVVGAVGFSVGKEKPPVFSPGLFAAARTAVG
jgi:hypothetical protein